MENYLYSSYELAVIILLHKMDMIKATEFLQEIYRYDNSFIELHYRHHQKEFILDVMNQVNAIQNQKQFELEKTMIEQDFHDLGMLSETSDYSDSENITYHFAFKELRLRTLYIYKQEQVRMKMRSFLRALKCKRRSANMINYIYDCLLFYHISISLSENAPCDLNEVGMDKMLIFKII